VIIKRIALSQRTDSFISPSHSYNTSKLKTSKIGRQDSVRTPSGLCQDAVGNLTSSQIRVFLVVLSLAPLATSRSAVQPWPVPRVSVRRVVPSNSGRWARMRSASGGTKPRVFCTPRCAAGLTESSTSGATAESQALRNARQIAFRVSVSRKVPPSLR